jgi:hypothetical protein
MKKLKLIAAGIAILITTVMHSQISINVNIGSPPSWGPSGYSNVDYYYLPDIQVYYDLGATQFIYFGNGRWNRCRELPRQYRNYDLFGGYKVVLNDYHGSRPYDHYHEHKIKYCKGYRGKPQKNNDKHYAHHDDEDDDHDHNDHRGKGHNKHERGHH